MAFAGIALMAAVFVGVAVAKYRASRSPHAQGFVEVDQVISHTLSLFNFTIMTCSHPIIHVISMIDGCRASNTGRASRSQYANQRL
jgi:hypothetical protein